VGPSINAEIFPNTNSAWHQTSTTRGANVLSVSFTEGSVVSVGKGFVPGSGRVRLVRGGE